MNVEACSLILFSCDANEFAMEKSAQKKRIGKTTDSSTNGPREKKGRKGDGREKDGSVLHTLNVNLSGADITFPQAASLL